MPFRVKICGVRTAPALEAAIAAGADAVGFVRFARSPRHVALDQGRELAAAARGRAARVLLTVDADDAALDEAVAALEPDVLQLHGAETPERAAALRARFGRPVLKALPIGERADLRAIDLYRGAADALILDARPPRGAALPGGNGRAFDWTLLAGLRPDPGLPLILSGGLTPDNVAVAIRTSGLRAVDVSSGVERAPGDKDPALIGAFVSAAQAAFSSTAQPPHPEVPGKAGPRRTHDSFGASFEAPLRGAPQDEDRVRTILRAREALGS